MRRHATGNTPERKIFRVANKESSADRKHRTAFYRRDEKRPDYLKRQSGRFRFGVVRSCAFRRDNHAGSYQLLATGDWFNLLEAIVFVSDNRVAQGCGT